MMSSSVARMSVALWWALSHWLVLLFSSLASSLMLVLISVFIFSLSSELLTTKVYSTRHKKGSSYLLG